MIRRPTLRRLARIAAYAGAGLVALAVVIAVGAPIYFRGERFGKLVERMLPETRGHTHVGGGHWNWGTVISLVRGRPAGIAFEDVTIIDPEGMEVLHIDRVSARIEVHRRPTRVIIHDLDIKDARWRFARMKNQNKIGFLAAFEGVPRKVRKPSKPSSAELSIVGARLDGVDATFDLPTWGLVLRDVHGTGALALKPKSFTFEVKDADVLGSGRLRILGEKSGVVLPIDRGRLERVATTADDPDSIRLDASDVATGRSRTSGRGVFTGIYGITPASKHSGIDLEVHLANAADAINAIAAQRGLGKRVHVTGTDADVRLRFKQPFDRIAIEAGARGLDVTSKEIAARDVGFHLTTEPMAGRFHLERLSLASPEGGRVEAEASLDRLQLDAKLKFAHFAARPVLPPALRSIGGEVDGLLQARADLFAGDAELVRSTLVVKRPGLPVVVVLAGGSARPPPGATVVRLGGAKLVAGVLRVPRLAFSMWGGNLSAEGRIALWDPDERQWHTPPRMDLALQGSGIQIERLIGSGFARGSLSFRAQARGSAEDLALEITFSDAEALTVLGERVRLPPRAALRLRESGIAIENLPLGGPGGSVLICSGQIAASGRLALDVGVVRFPLARIPGILGTTLPVAGSISGSVRIVGQPRAPALSGDVALTDVSYAGYPLGGGTIVLSPESKGGVRARGHLIDAIAVDGRLVTKHSGIEGDATLTLTKVPLEPFVPLLPGKTKVRGVVSGTAVARIAPDHPATAEAKLSELALSLASPAVRGRPAGTLDVVAENEIVLRAQAGEGLSFGPARLRSNLGVLELSGESHGEALRASLRGRLELGGLAAFARPWLDRLAGSLDVDLAATGRGAFDDLSVNGDVVIAAPISLRPASLSIEASVPSGRLRVVKNSVEVSGLPVVVRAERFPAAAVRKLEANARVNARLDGASGKLGARIALDNLDVHIPLVGKKPVRSAGGQIDISGDVDGGKFDVTRIDLPFTAEAEALAATAGAMVDRATVALRVQGSSRQLALSGDVDVGSAHLRADALKSPGGSSSGGGGSGSAKKGPLAGHPEIEQMRLDVRVRSGGGAIHVDVNNLPDLRVDVDMHVGGTVKKPSISGAPRGANFWSSFVLALAKLFS
jgi:hypothetical protein